MKTPLAFILIVAFAIVAVARALLDLLTDCCAWLEQTYGISWHMLVFGAVIVAITIVCLYANEKSKP